MNGNDTNRFDEALRGHHAIAVQRISPRVRAQLAQRRNAALRGERTAARGHGFRYAAAAFAAVFALAIGIQLRPIHTVPGKPAVSVATATATGQDRTGTTMLDEDPSFYAWLDSSDVRQLAME